jgi:SAM-dependent methyltransferase
MAHGHLADLLDLDAEVLHDYHHEVISWVTSALPADPLIVDLGAGSGTGTIALARAVPAARLVAVDVDDEMLTHLRDRATTAGVADRVRTVRADLDQPWPVLGPADLIWASASMHHMADPANALAEVFRNLKPGGRFAITELDSFPRFLSDRSGSALEDRLHAAAAARRDEAGLHMHEDWTALLAKTGFQVEAERRFDISLAAPLPEAAGRYAQVNFGRLRHGLADRLTADDAAALDALLPTLPSRPDLVVRTTRTVWLARRPA